MYQIVALARPADVARACVATTYRSLRASTYDTAGEGVAERVRSHAHGLTRPMISCIFFFAASRYPTVRILMVRKKIIVPSRTTAAVHCTVHGR